MSLFFSRRACPACQSPKATVFHDLPYADGPVANYLFRYYKLDRFTTRENWAVRVGTRRYVLKSCNDCQLWYQQEVPSDALAAELYGTWIATPVEGVTAFSGAKLETASHYVSEALKLTALARRLGNTPSYSEIRALDFGMGRGGFALALKACLIDVAGFEFAADRDALGAKLGIRMLTIDEIDSGADFDLINTEQVFEHLPTPLETAKRLVRGLKPGGLLKISVPFNRWIEKGETEINWNAGRYARQSPTPAAPLEHLQYYHRPSLDALGNRLGLTRVRIPRWDHIYYGLRWSAKGTVKNIGRAVAMDQFRNYYIFQKPK